MTTPPTSTDISAFVDRWKCSAAAETANFQSFTHELCDLLGLPRPEPTTKVAGEDAYVFERAVEFRRKGQREGVGRIDLYRRGAFIMEAKQGSGSAEGRSGAVGTARRGTGSWDTAMDRAYQQGLGYARAIATTEGETHAPFLLVVDVGFTIDVYADFSRTSVDYHHFPSVQTSRIALDDLHDEAIQARLRSIWLDPWDLDPSRRAARVTRKVAERLAQLAQELERDGHHPQTVAAFLMRCLFTMFAEDTGLLPEDSFTRLLEECEREKSPVVFQMLVQQLWRDMDLGGADGVSSVLRKRIRRFNGGLFTDTTVLPLNPRQLALLIDAARADWRDVEPAIFGTLLERALAPAERHKLGAHYTPRVYVERLVMPTIIEPLRGEWANVRVEALRLQERKDTEGAVKTVKKYHHHLCSLRVLDPACGSGNFLYITMEHLKRLEAEVIALLEQLDSRQAALEVEGFSVNPSQFLGIELNPRAAAIADLVLWLGYLRWQLEHAGLNSVPDPVLQDFKNIENRDAVLAHDGEELALDERGEPIPTWDRVTFRTHPITGEKVPDESAVVHRLRYKKPRRASWPKVDYIIGNPPFIGNWKMRQAFGDGYAETLREVYPEVPESTEFVMYWWDKAATLVREGHAERFGFITTNSITQVHARKVIKRHLEAPTPLRLRFAIPDHPWVDSAEGADVRVGMTAGDLHDAPGELLTVTAEVATDEGHREVDFSRRIGTLHSNLRADVDITKATGLQANSMICSPGVKLHGAGFIVSPEQAKALGLGRIPGLEHHIRHYRNGRDINQKPRGVMVIDLFGLEPAEVRDRYPEVYQHVVDHVKPERDINKRATYRDLWWVFGEPRSKLRPVLSGLSRYIATVETSKHRFFVFLDAEILPDNRLVNVGSDDAFVLGVLSSSYHTTWALSAGGALEDRPVYTKTVCFDPFPFPACSEDVRDTIRDIAERLDTHRKSRQALHPSLKLTELYNVVEALRAGRALTDKERRVHEEGAAGVLRQLHDELDDAVRVAYGWPEGMSEEEILAAIADLNAERAAEEARGDVRWLRPSFQAPHAVEAAPEQLEADLGHVEAPALRVAAADKVVWPSENIRQVEAVHAVLRAASGPLDAAGVAAHFKRAQKKRIEEILKASVMLGYIHSEEQGWAWG